MVPLGTREPLIKLERNNFVNQFWWLEGKEKQEKRFITWICDRNNMKFNFIG